MTRRRSERSLGKGQDFKLKIVHLAGRFPFLSKVLMLTSGTVAGQVILLATLPILTRLYSAEEFGVLGIVTMLVGILAVPACLRLELAIPLPRSDTAAAQLFIGGLVAATAFAFFLAVSVALAPKSTALLLGQPSLSGILWIIAPCTWLLSVYSLVQFWAIRKQRVGDVAKTQVTRAIGGSATQTAAGILGYGSIGLLVGFLAYNFLGTLGLAFSALRKDSAAFLRASTDRMFWGLHRYRRHIMFSMPQSLLNMLAVNAPLIIVAAAVGQAEAGFMLLAFRVASIPVGIIGSNLSRIYLADAAAKSRQGALVSFTAGIAVQLARIGVPLFLAMALVSPLVFPLIFGSEWVRAGSMVSMLAPALFIQFVFSPVSSVFVVCDRMDLAFLAQLLGVALIFAPLWYATQSYPNITFEVFAIVLLLYYVVQLLSVFYAIRKCAPRV